MLPLDLNLWVAELFFTTKKLIKVLQVANEHEIDNEVEIITDAWK